MAMFEKRNLNIYSHPSGIGLDTRKGVVSNRSGTRLIGITEDFLRGFVAAIENEVGPATQLLLRKCGVVFGKRLAQRFENEISTFAGVAARERPMAEFGQLLIDLWSTYGFGGLKVDWTKGAAGILPIKLDGSPMQDIGPKGHVADDLFTGILQGFFSHFTDPSIRCVQTGDLRLGNREGTTFIITTDKQAKRVEQLAGERLPHSEIVARMSNQ
jgi:predicted hydrocarbon binding protein